MIYLMLLVGLILTVTAALTVRARGKMAPLSPLVLLFGVVIAGALAITGGYFRFVSQETYDDCAASVSRSDGNRAQHLAIAQRLDDRGLHDDAEYLRSQLRANLPDRSIDECGDKP